MKKDMRLKALQELKEEFKVNGQMNTWFDIYELLRMDYIPNDMDVYEVTITNQSKSLINGWTSHIESTEYYKFYVEMIKNVNDKILSEWVIIEQDDENLLIKVYEILNS